MESSNNAASRRSLSGQAAHARAKAGVHLPFHLLGKLSNKPTHPLVIVLESLLLPVIALILGQAWAPDNPLQVGAGFPWPWLAPVILALRYGPLSGLAGALVLLGGWLWLNAGQYDQFPQMYFLGGLVLVLLVGEFSSLWHTRTRRAETLQHYLDQRLEHLVRQHYLLRLSHDRLEQELIGRPMSMRDALSTLREVGRHDNLPEAPDTLMRLLAQYCQLESAALFPVTDDKPGTQPQASLGNSASLDLSDPMVQQALRQRKLCHISQDLASQKQSRYLVVAPLLDLADSLYGLLVVEDMPFFALQEESLQTINLLLGYYTDGLSANTLAAPIVQAHPGCPPEFAFEVARLSHLYQSTKVPSVVVVLECHERAVQADIPQQIERLKREMDEVWYIPHGERITLAVLMPLGDSSTAEGYITRLEGWSQQKSQRPLAEQGLFPHVLHLEKQSAEQTISRILEIAHV